MKIILGAFLIAVTYAIPAFESRSNIVGGSDAALGEFPYQVLVEYTYLCGGSILSPNFVLTAAHCATGRADQYTVTAGIVNSLYPESSEQAVKVDEIIVHENYWNIHAGYDIALLKLKQRFIFNEFVGPCNLPSMGQVMTGNCVATGWGELSQGGATSIILQKVTLPVIPDLECMEYLPLLRPNMLCAGYKNGGKDSCAGDSGGPLTCNGVVGGITSWGYGCAQPNNPGVYTEVTYFLDWIDANTQN